MSGLSAGDGCASRILKERRDRVYDMDLCDRTDTINELLARYGVKFGIYKNNTFK